MVKHNYNRIFISHHSFVLSGILITLPWHSLKCIGHWRSCYDLATKCSQRLMLGPQIVWYSLRGGRHFESWNLEEVTRWGHAFEVAPILGPFLVLCFLSIVSWRNLLCHMFLPPTAQGQATRDRTFRNSRNNHVLLRLFLSSMLPQQWDNYDISRQVQLKMDFLQPKCFLLEFTLE